MRNRPDEIRQHAGLRRGDQVADRSAEPAIVEGAGGRRIAVEGIAVVIAGRALGSRDVLHGCDRRTPADPAPHRPGASWQDRRRSCTWSRRAHAPAVRSARRETDRRARQACLAQTPSADASVRIAVSSESTCVWVSSRVATIGFAGAEDTDRSSAACWCRGSAATRARRRRQVGRHLRRRPFAGKHRHRRRHPRAAPAPAPAGPGAACRRRAAAAHPAVAGARLPSQRTAGRGPGRPRRSRCTAPRESKASARALARTAAACAAVDSPSADPGAFSMSTTRACGSMARTVSRSAGQITMTTREPRIMSRSIARNTPRISARTAEREVRELLRQARVHIVEVRHPQQFRQHDANEATLLVRMDHVVVRAERAAHDAECQEHIERQLRQRRTDLHAAQERRSQSTGTRASRAWSRPARTDR